MENSTDQFEKGDSRGLYSPRPSLLRFLCVLTFIGSGLSAISYLWIGFSLDTVRQLVFQSGAYDAYFEMVPSARQSLETTFSLPRYYFLLTGLLYLVSVTGAALMWTLRRIGFHVYALAQCVLIIFGMLMIPSAGVPWGGIIWTAIFVLLYGFQLKYMNRGNIS